MKISNQQLLITILANVVIGFQSKHVPNSYLVKLSPTSRTGIESHLESVKELFVERDNINQIQSVFTNVGNLYHATFSPSVLDRVRKLPGVESIEQDTYVKLATVQTGAPWGLARLSNRKKLTDANNSKYTYLSDGSGITVYVVDSGLVATHPEFEGRAVVGATFGGGSPTTDPSSHGTHCAGSVGSKTFGVAKKVDIVGVKVCDEQNQCKVSSIVAGLNWVIGDKRGRKGNVMSLSIQTSVLESIDSAVLAAIKNNFVVVAAAGNDSDDACLFSPAHIPQVITVAASDIEDNRAGFSNYGKCIDIFAPGVGILSTWSDGKSKLSSGTSMATPQVAGLAAYFWGMNSTLTNTQVVEKVISSGTKNAIGDVKGSANLLVFNNAV